MSNKYFEAKIWMKSKQGENDFSMFINEQPEGGFKWQFLDYEPEDKENYSPLIVHNFTLSDIVDIQKELETTKRLLGEAVEVMNSLYLNGTWSEYEREKFIAKLSKEEK